MKAKRFRTEC